MALQLLGYDWFNGGMPDVTTDRLHGRRRGLRVHQALRIGGERYHGDHHELEHG